VKLKGALSVVQIFFYVDRDADDDPNASLTVSEGPIPLLPMTGDIFMVAGDGKSHAGIVLKRLFKYEFLPVRIDLKITIYAEGLDVPKDDSPSFGIEGRGSILHFVPRSE
jgi:hypothetical protein